MTQIDLQWHGPFSLVSPKDRTEFDPPTCGGVYVWCIGKAPALRISYVGEAENIRARMYQHIHSTLGGAYCLYSEDQLRDGDVSSSAYTPGLENILSSFLGDYDRHTKMAHDNLMAYTFCWTAVDGDRSLRRAVESALIDAFTKSSEPLQNARRSVIPDNCRKISIASTFVQGNKLVVLPETLDYGTLE